jgi:cobalt/nickel transport system ATP-binding protein
MIELIDVSFSYEDGREALSQVSCTIQAGESVAFIGPNGSGKSTLLKLLNGLVFPCMGTYRFSGAEITRKAMVDPGFSKGFHGRMGLLFPRSDSQLFSVSVYDEIAFGPRQMGMDESTVHTRVRDCMGLLLIEGLGERVPYHLSDGEKRRVALASVLSMNPEVLVLDEPLSGLDPGTKRSIAEVMRGLHAAGKTILCATHDFAHVKGLFERCIVMSAGHTIIRDGRYHAVLADSDFLASQNII